MLILTFLLAIKYIKLWLIDAILDGLNGSCKNTVWNSGKNLGFGVTQSGVPKLWTWAGHSASLRTCKCLGRLEHGGHHTGAGSWDWRAKQELHHGVLFYSWMVYINHPSIASPPFLFGEQKEIEREGDLKWKIRFVSSIYVTLGKTISVSLVTSPL